MAASSKFPNFGQKRLKIITDNCSLNLKKYDEEELALLREKINSLKGFKKLTDIFLNSYPLFCQWIKRHPQISFNKVESPAKLDDIIDIKDISSLKDQVLVLTGWRASVLLEREIEKRGGKIKSLVSKKTTSVIAQNMDENTDKISKAKQYNIPVMNKADFLKIYNLSEL